MSVHLRECPACRAEVAELLPVVSILRRTPIGELAAVWPQAFDRSLN